MYKNSCKISLNFEIFKPIDHYPHNSVENCQFYINIAVIFGENVFRKWLFIKIMFAENALNFLISENVL